MNLKWTIPRLALISVLMMIFIVVVGAAQPWFGSNSSYTEEHYFEIIIDSEAYMMALLEHAIDMGGVPLPEYLPDLIDAEFTITTTTRMGYTFTMENNRRWPFGGYTFDDPTYGRCGTGQPTDPWYENATAFRKGIHRLINKPWIVGNLYAPLNSECEYYLPPPQAYWRNPDAPGPDWNPGTCDDVLAGVDGIVGTEDDVETASAYLNFGGFTPGTADNTYADVDTSASWYCDKLRIDPMTGETMEEFEYYAIGPAEAPIGFEMASKIVEWWHTAGIPCTLTPGTWLGMVIALTNSVLEDYQFMTGVGITWSSPAPDILYDFTYHENLPLWNFVGMNITDLNEAGIRMMSTLDIVECRQAAYDMQTLLASYEPYMPMLLWEMFIAETGPYEDEPGMIGIINMEGQGAHASGNAWGKQISRAERYDPGTGAEINKWGLGAYLDTLNPLMADTVPDWQCLANIMEGSYGRNPYTLEYMFAAAKELPTIQEWIGPGGSDVYGGYDGCEAVYDNAYNGTHYACIGENEVAETPQGTYVECQPITPGGDDVVKPIADGPFTCDCGTFGPYEGPYVTQADLAGDDVLGMCTTWNLRQGMFWHDSDPGADMIFGTTDDGDVHPVTTADIEFGFNLLRYQENVRYASQWQYVYAVEVENTTMFHVFEERRFLFAFEGHDVSMLCPKHLYEDYIFGEGEEVPTGWTDQLEIVMPCGAISTGDCWDYYSQDDSAYEHHHDEWAMWEEEYMVDPTDPAGRMLTYLIGFGPFKYHLGDWVPGDHVKFTPNPTYYGGHICLADLDFNQKAEPATVDIHDIMSSVGPRPYLNPPMESVRADICYPAQLVQLAEILEFIEHSGHYWGPDPVPEGFVRCPPETTE